jgi:hypothetical protein
MKISQESLILEFLQALQDEQKCNPSQTHYVELDQITVFVDDA